MGENQRDSIRRLSYSDGKVKIQNPIHMSQIQGKKGIISIELNTVKDINNKFRAYNLVISVFSAKNNYIRNNIKKHVVDIKYAKDDLSQVNPQLYEWLAIINDKSSYDDRLPQNSYKSNPSQQNNSDSGKEFNDPNKRFSKDDTIFDDFEDEEWLWQSDERSAAVDPDDPLGLMAEPETESSATTENAPILTGTRLFFPMAG